MAEKKNIDSTKLSIERYAEKGYGQMVLWKKSPRIKNPWEKNQLKSRRIFSEKRSCEKKVRE